MTEKEFRRLVTDLEILSEERLELEKSLEFVKELLTKNLSKYINVIDVKKGGAWAKGTMLNDTDEIDILVLVESKLDKPFVLKNEAVLNEIINAFIYEACDILKLSDISKNTQLNIVSIKLSKCIINLHIKYQNEQYLINDVDKQIQFVEIANRDYTYFRNAVKIIKYYKETQKINVSGYIIEILLYYSLTEYFKDNRYESYLGYFIRAIDDFIKGKIIQVTPDIYEKLEVSPIYDNKKKYMILDVSNPKNNLVEGISEININEYRKLKKVLSKLADTKQDLSFGTNAKVVLNINPVAIKNSDEYSWSYTIENSDYHNAGGSYKNTPEEMLTAMYKGLYKGLRAIIDNNLNRKNVEVISNRKDLLKIVDTTSEENRSRIKNIEAYIENNNIVMTFK